MFLILFIIYYLYLLFSSLNLSRSFFQIIFVRHKRNQIMMMMNIDKVVSFFIDGYDFLQDIPKWCGIYNIKLNHKKIFYLIYFSYFNSIENGVLLVLM